MKDITGQYARTSGYLQATVKIAIIYLRNDLPAKDVVTMLEESLAKLDDDLLKNDVDNEIASPGQPV